MLLSNIKKPTKTTYEKKDDGIKDKIDDLKDDLKRQEMMNMMMQQRMMYLQ